MRIFRLIGLVLLLPLVVWGIEVLYLLQRNASTPSKIQTQGKAGRTRLMAEFKGKERDLVRDYEQRKYLATGETAYDRIFNTQGQTINQLIQCIATEALPKTWSCEVQVEEFTHFLLLILLPHNEERVAATRIAVHLKPIIAYCNPYLSDVAVFDRNHKSYLFFDQEILEHLRNGGNLTDALVAKVEHQGRSFTRFNSTTIPCEKHESHLFLSTEVIGPSALVTCYALFDTGASTTVLSSEVITATGNDDLTTAPKRTFQTANGLLSCPIVRREVNLAGIRRNIEVAVNQRDEVNLIGMNYFSGLKYIVDSEASCIHVWEK